ncbi:hypothetical protein GS400_12905 [Pontibacillus sp. HMF3514]|nr:hypothetical protein GS400_12905 [Pontibacillus sp. HMF3514]
MNKRDFKENLIIFGIMLVAVPLAGELKFHPFNGDFRVSFGTPVFFLFLLWIRKINPIISGLFVGAFVVVFRLILDELFVETYGWEETFRIHAPVFFYYFTYGIAFSLAKIPRFYEQPMWIGVFGVLIEVVASLSEILFRFLLLNNSFTFIMMVEIFMIAIIRSFFVVGFFNISLLKETKMKEEEQRKRNEKMALVISNLYEESIQLKKTMHHAENVTRDSYNLYRQLKNHTSDMNPYSQDALKIAGQVHEIKKDNNRIFAGLSRLISHEDIKDVMNVVEIGELVVKSNQKYAQLLGKEIHFDLKVDGEHDFYQTFTTLSLINNLVSNSVEAIQESGQVCIHILKVGEHVEFRVSDNGPGVPEKYHYLMYEHGFTTKYDISGEPSTGIGLSYVKSLVESLEGSILLENHHEGCTFKIQLPINQLVK